MLAMEDDPILAEVRAIRDKLAAKFNYDVHAIAKYLRERQRKGGHKVVSLPPKRPAARK
jgi:hypothetical protein